MITLALALTLAASAQDAGFQLPIEETVLDNGMRVLVIPRRDVPRVHCSLWWRVGSVNERPGVTGLSHFFEHMMFMGTRTIGTTDPDKDAELNAAIEKVMNKVRKLKLRRLEQKRRGLKPARKAEEKYKALMEEYTKLVEEQKKIIIPEHLSKIFQAHGGTGLNASTSFDRTNYFVELPANKVELFMWLESDRFKAPVFRSFYPEREVVKEERRMRYDSTPTGLVNQQFWSSFWQSHPYSWPVIGWMSDIDQYRLKDAQAYYDTHYSPENCTALFVGDVDAAEIKALATKYFGRLERFKGGRDPIVTQEPVQKAERRTLAEADATPSIEIQWHGPPGVHRDSAACDLLANVFDGRSGRLYKPLVEEKKLAVSASSYYWSLRYGGAINLSITPRDDADFAEAERELLAIVEKVRAEGVTERELQKVKNSMTADMVRGLGTYTGIARQIGYFETIGTYKDFFAYMDHLSKVTAEDVKRCAGTYLTPEGRNVLVIKRKAKAKAEGGK